jgi:beta-phosphoglucomutase
MTQARAAVWDVDGTLVDTGEQHFEAWVAVCREYGRDFTRAEFTETFGRRNPEIITYLFGDKLTPKQALELADRKEVLYRSFAQSIPLLPGVKELLDGLRAADFRQGIGSSAPRLNLEHVLKLSGVAEYFDAVVGAEQCQRGKPDPQVFLVACEQLKVAPARTVVFEDAVAGVQAARAGGMKCVAVRFVGHHPEERLRAAGADLVVETLHEVTTTMVERLIGT